jgi:hypothetical protein
MRGTAQAFALGSMLGSLVLGSSALAQDGPEVDLTGTWEGEQICEELIGGEFVNTVIIDNPLLVVQDGGTFSSSISERPRRRLQTISSMRVSFKM